MTTLKIAALSAFAALGISSAALAQTKDERSEKNAMPADHSEMMAGDMGGMKGMMNDPEMREQMKQMMSNCHKMMEAKHDKMPAK
ncbi:hypothetical protein A9995_10380 [Erythrobacter sp. QSSC1-22B]|uniref:hypothetical protein n=1 Tax=Erythrobacter sp. QSSC1-22B TaxID=1860125 RepID=UPI000804D694|nr:hypothetical protein [Erythrobacter sp. QSSC1-22B]OBX18939.1 hypothetical protein A9995_10380 [Erythrobacter sp. QSSC1-22B]